MEDDKKKKKHMLDFGKFYAFVLSLISTFDIFDPELYY